MKTERFDIKNGPGKDKIVNAFKYAFDRNVNFDVRFVVAKAYTAPKSDPRCAYEALPIRGLTITSISHEDGSGHSFNLGGFCEVAITQGKFVHTWFEAYYNANNRTGWISFGKGRTQ